MFYHCIYFKYIMLELPMDQSLTQTNARELKHTSMAHRRTNTRFLATNAAVALTVCILALLFHCFAGSTLTDEITSPFIDAAPSNCPCGTGARTH
jgi:hypothetical protein